MRRVNHSYFSFSNVGSYGSISADIYDISAVPTLCPTKVVRWDITLVTFVLDLFICVLPIPSLYPSLYPLIPLPPSLSLPSRFSTCPSIHPSIYLIYLSIYLSVYLSIYLSLRLSVCLSLSLRPSVLPFLSLSLSHSACGRRSRPCAGRQLDNSTPQSYPVPSPPRPF